MVLKWGAPKVYGVAHDCLQHARHKQYASEGQTGGRTFQLLLNETCMRLKQGVTASAAPPRRQLLTASGRAG